MIEENTKETGIRRATCECCGRPIDLTREKIIFNPLLYGSNIKTCADCRDRKKFQEREFKEAVKSVKFILL